MCISTALKPWERKRIISCHNHNETAGPNWALTGGKAVFLQPRDAHAPPLAQVSVRVGCHPLLIALVVLPLCLQIRARETGLCFPSFCLLWSRFCFCKALHPGDSFLRSVRTPGVYRIACYGGLITEGESFPQLYGA